MQVFLEVQRSTMLAYLTGAARRARRRRRIGGFSRPDSSDRSDSSHTVSSHQWQAPPAADARHRRSRRGSSDQPAFRLRPSRRGASNTRTPRHVNGKAHEPACHVAAAADARTATRSPPGCSRPSAIGRATRSRHWGWTWTWRPTWGSIRSSESRSSARCAMNSRPQGPVRFRRGDGRTGPGAHARA